MKHLTDIATLIENAGLGTKAKDVFIGTLPGGLNSGVMIRPPLTGTKIDEGLRGFHEAEVMIIVRDPSPAAGYDKALQLQTALAKHNVTIGETYFGWMRPTELPVSYPRGDGDEVETAFDLQIGFAYVA